MDSISPAVYLIPPLMGVAAYLALNNVWIWLGRRSEPLHLWVSLWCANSLLYLASHYVQIASALPGHAVLGGRLAWTSAIVLIVTTIGLSHALAESPLPRWLLWGAGILNAGLLLLVWLTDLLVTGRAYVRTDLLGYQYGAPVPGPLLPLLAPYTLAVFAYAWRTLGRGEMDRGERRAIRAGFAVYIVLALNDMLHAARLIQSIRVSDLGFVAVGVGLTYMLVRRYNRLYAHLEEEVSVRTQAAYAREKEAAALAGVGGLISQSIEVDQVAQRIVDSLCALLHAPAAVISEILPDSGDRRILAAAGTAEEGYRRGQVVPGATGVAGLVVAGRQAMATADFLTVPGVTLSSERREELDRLGQRAALLVPLLSGENVVGVLAALDRTGRVFGGDDLRLATAFAQHAAVALERAHIRRELKARLARLEALTRISRMISSSLEAKAVLREICRAAAELMGVPMATFWRADEAARTLTLVAMADPAAEADWKIPVTTFDQGMTGWIATHKRPLHVPDFSADPRIVDPGWWRARGLTSGFGVPVLLEGALLAVLVLDDRAPFRLGPDDERLLGAFVAQAAVAIQNASLYGSAQAQARELQALRGVGAALVSTLDLPSVLGAITTSARDLTGAAGSSVFELAAAEGVLQLRASHGIDESRTPKALRLGQGAAGAAALRREPVWSPDVSVRPLPGYEEEAPGLDRPLGQVVGALAYRGMLGVPLVSRATVFGAICLYWYEAHTPEEQEIRVLTAFAQQAAMALENARLHAALGRRLVRMETLARLTRVLSSSLDRDRILTEIARAAAELAEARFATIWLADEATQTLTLGSVSDPGINADWAPTTLPFGQSGVGWIAAHRRALQADDSFADDRFLQPEWRRKHGLKAFLGLPVIHEGVLVAVLSLSGPRPFSREPEDEALLSAFAAQAAVAIGNASLYEAEGRARRAAELALAQVKQLQGMLPICAYCKKVRDDSNYWQSIEAYIGQRSAATFSHGICPDCREKIVKPELERWRREQGKDR